MAKYLTSEEVEDFGALLAELGASTVSSWTMGADRFADVFRDLAIFHGWGATRRGPGLLSRGTLIALDTPDTCATSRVTLIAVEKR